MKLFQTQLNRRSFLRGTAIAATGAALPEWYRRELSAAEPPANLGEKPAVALIGCGGQGRGITQWASKFGRVAAVCDVDKARAAEAAKQFAGAKVYHDFREVLAREDIAAILNGTPDHWHTIINIAAMNQGKDVYSEKPLTLTIDEGKRVVEAWKKSGRVFQTGSQQRSDARFRLACELVRNGRIGNVREVVSILPSGPHAGPFETAPVPSGLDWDLWQGQTRPVEYVPQRCHGSFRYWLDYSGGTMTDWGGHHNDIALWGLGLERGGPVSVVGRRLVEPIPGGFDAPSEYEVHYTYANGVKQTCRSNRDRPDGSPPEGGRGEEEPHGVKFIGNGGWIFVTRGEIKASEPAILSDPLPENALRLYKSDDHMGNFFECMRTRKQPICDAEIGHRSASVCHLGVIAIRLGRSLQWDPEKQQFVNDAEANGLVARPMRTPYDYSYAS